MYSLLRDSINFLSQINSSEVYAHTASRKLIFCYGHVVESVYTNKIVSIKLTCEIKWKPSKLVQKRSKIYVVFLINQQTIAFKQTLMHTSTVLAWSCDHVFSR